MCLQKIDQSFDPPDSQTVRCVKAFGWKSGHPVILIQGDSSIGFPIGEFVREFTFREPLILDHLVVQSTNLLGRFTYPTGFHACAIDGKPVAEVSESLKTKLTRLGWFNYVLAFVELTDIVAIGTEPLSTDKVVVGKRMKICELIENVGCIGVPPEVPYTDRVCKMEIPDANN